LAIFATAPGVSAAGLRAGVDKEEASGRRNLQGMINGLTNGERWALEHFPPFDPPWAWEKKLPDSDSVLVSVSGVTSQEKDPMQKAINLATDAYDLSRPSSERRSLYVKHELVGPLVGAINTPGTGGMEGPGGYAGGYNDGSYGYDNYGDSYDYDDYDYDNSGDYSDSGNNYSNGSGSGNCCTSTQTQGCPRDMSVVRATSACGQTTYQLCCDSAGAGSMSCNGYSIQAFTNANIVNDMCYA
jgi:hypothetical protein